MPAGKCLGADSPFHTQGTVFPQEWQPCRYAVSRFSEEAFPHRSSLILAVTGLMTQVVPCICQAAGGLCLVSEHSYYYAEVAWWCGTRKYMVGCFLAFFPKWEENAQKRTKAMLISLPINHCCYRAIHLFFSRQALVCPRLVLDFLLRSQ